MIAFASSTRWWSPIVKPIRPIWIFFKFWNVWHQQLDFGNVASKWVENSCGLTATNGGEKFLLTRWRWKVLSIKEFCSPLSLPWCSPARMLRKVNVFMVGGFIFSYLFRTPGAWFFLSGVSQRQPKYLSLKARISTLLGEFFKPRISKSSVELKKLGNQFICDS